MDSGFAVLPCAVPARRVAEIGTAYDELMLAISSPDFKAGSTTDRRFFLDRGITFEDVYGHPFLLRACAELIAQPFRLSSLLGRNLRAGNRAQDIHTDITPDCADAPMPAFILMLDAFTRA